VVVSHTPSLRTWPRKIAVMQPHIDAQAATGKSGVAAVGVSQEFQRVWSAYQRTRGRRCRSTRSRKRTGG
jgi:hypothetical protein